MLHRFNLARTMARVLLVTLACGLVALLTAAGSAAQTSAVVFTVNSTADDADASPGNGVCATATNVCTLRAALEEANRAASSSTVAFNIAGAGVQTIRLVRALPPITTTRGAVLINGYSQPGALVNTNPLISNAQIRVQLEGLGEQVTGAQWSALQFNSAGHTVRGLAIYKVWRAIWLSGTGARNIAIVGNFIGTNAAGSYRTPSRVQSAAGGVLLDSGANTNWIGRPALADRNVISGNPNSGVFLTGEGTDATLIQNNLIGLTPNGTAGLGNWGHGIDMNYGASNNQVGGANVTEGNLLSGNGISGAESSHGSTTQGNRIIGNRIGTAPNGSAVAAYTANGAAGVSLQDGSNGNLVAQNVIGGNRGGGVEVNGAPSNHIRSNVIGRSRDGMALSNQLAGIRLWAGSTGTLIGPDNLIANNPVGVLLDDDATDRNTITRNVLVANSGLGIDIAPVGINGPDQYAHSGPNGRLNPPLLTRATPASVRGSTCGGCTVELYRADGAAGVAGEGTALVGAATAANDGSFTTPISGVAVGDTVTATATDRDGNTSEFARNIAVAP